MNLMYRQGDVLLIRIDKPNLERARKLPREDGRVVLAHGEVTGHAHTIHHPGAMLFDLIGEDHPILDLPENATLSHEEHDPIELPAGQYRIVQQREYNEREHGGWAYVED